jgi:predicted ester cyclase
MQINSELSSQEEKNKEMVVRFYTEAHLGINEDVLSDDFVGNAPGVPPFNREGFVRALNEITAAFPDGRYVNDDVVVEGDKVVTFGRFQGTYTGNFHWIPPTGRRITLTAVHIDRIADGKIVQHLRMSDSAELGRQLSPSSPSMA